MSKVQTAIANRVKVGRDERKIIMNLWQRIAQFFKEWDGEDMTKSMPLMVEDLQLICSQRVSTHAFERECKELCMQLKARETELEIMRDKLALLTDCPKYGECDSMSGTCIDCNHDTPELTAKCSKFQDEFTKMLKETRK